MARKACGYKKMKREDGWKIGIRNYKAVRHLFVARDIRGIWVEGKKKKSSSRTLTDGLSVHARAFFAYTSFSPRGSSERNGTQRKASQIPSETRGPLNPREGSPSRGVRLSLIIITS
jgi:hypothetical protein